jgi:hypothetical protein
MVRGGLTRAMKRCLRCVLPESTPDISFDENGICSYCHNHHKIEYKGEAELIRLLDSYRSNKKYDCIVNISGGRDSSYTLLKVVKDYGMKTLAVNYQNPFTHPQAIANIENAVKVLNVDLVRFKLKNNMHERTLRDNTLTWFRNPSPAMVPMICVACKNIWWHVVKIARSYDIRCVISGGNQLEETSFKKVLLHMSGEDDPSKHFTKSLYGILMNVWSNPGYIRLPYLPTMIKGYLFGNPYAIGPSFFGHNIAKVDIFNYIEWNENTVLSRIKSEIGWDCPKESSSTWRIDCRVGHLKDFMYMKTLKVTEKDDFYSKMVREGIISREEALKRLQKENELNIHEVRQLLTEVGVTV